MSKTTFLNILNRVLQIIVLIALTKFLLGLKWHLVYENLDKFPKAIGLTIFLTASSLLIGFLIAVPLALYRVTGKNKFFLALANGYVSVFRGSPLLVQLFLIYYGLGQFEFIRNSFLWVVLRDPMPCAILAISLNSGAYACEIFRGALRQVPRGQIEAADSLGLSSKQRDWLVWVPMALRLSIPQYGNEMIFTMHSTALAGLVTINEVFGTAREINKSYYTVYEGMITAAMIYVILTIILSGIVKALEHHYLRYLKIR